MFSRHAIATSTHPLARAIRSTYHAIRGFTLPAPRIVTIPMLYSYSALQAVYHFVMRVFICEPLLKASCKTYGRRVHTDVFVHWIDGTGDLILGDDVLLDGKCTINFASRYRERPSFIVGSRTVIGHGGIFTIGKRIQIGNDCLLAAHVWMFDASGHATEPEDRLAHREAAEDDVREIIVADNVWIGGRAIVLPGVTIGEGSIVAAGAVVTTDVPPYTVVAGNPAKQVRTLHAARDRSHPGVSR